MRLGFQVAAVEFLSHFDRREHRLAIGKFGFGIVRALDISPQVAGEIDRLYWDAPYVVVPLDENSAEAYGVIQEAMLQENRIALGRVVMHSRERLMAIEPRGAGLLATRLRNRDEVVNTSAALSDVPHGKANKQMIEIA